MEVSSAGSIVGDSDIQGVVRNSAHLLLFSSGRLVMPTSFHSDSGDNVKAQVNTSGSRRHYSELVNLWHTDEFGKLSAHFCGLHSRYIAGSLKEGEFLSIINHSNNLESGKKQKQQKRIQKRKSDNNEKKILRPQQIKNRAAARAWECFRFVGDRSLAFNLRLKAKTRGKSNGNASVDEAISTICTKFGLKPKPSHPTKAKTNNAHVDKGKSKRAGEKPLIYWDEFGEAVRWPTSGVTEIDGCEGDGTNIIITRENEHLLSCKRLIAASEKKEGEFSLRSENRTETENIQWLRLLLEYMDGKVNPWNCPLIACRAILQADSVSVMPNSNFYLDISFKAHFAVYFGRLLFYLIADDALNVLLRPLTPVWKNSIAWAADIEEHSLTARPARMFTKSRRSSDDEFSVSRILGEMESTGYETMKQPLGLTLKMKDYQLQTLRWMLDQEAKADGLNGYFWKPCGWGDGNTSQPFYYSEILGEIRVEKPPLVRGGLLCEEMGLGKTLEIIALILASKTDDELRRRRNQPKVPRPSTSSVPSPFASNATLIIVPITLVTQWKSEILKSLIDAKSLSVIVYIKQMNSKKKERNLSLAANLAKADIVITTYGMVRHDKTLQYISWERICLDEMQEVRSSTTILANNCESLIAQNRWMISGTPLYTGIDDLNGELKFLGVIPFCLQDDKDGFWGHRISEPMKHREREALMILEGLMSKIMIRHSKLQTYVSTPQRTLLMLPPVVERDVPIVYPPGSPEMACYGILERLCVRLLKKLMSSNHSINENQSNNVQTQTAISAIDCLRIATISMSAMTGGQGFACKLNNLGAIARKILGFSHNYAGLSGAANISGDSFFSARIMSPENLRDYLLTSSAQNLSHDVAGKRTGSADANSRHRYANIAASGAGIAGAAQREHILLRYEEAKTKLLTAQKMISEGKSKLSKLRWRWLLRVCRSGAYFAVLMLCGKWNEVKVYKHTCSTLLTRAASHILLPSIRINKFSKVIEDAEVQLHSYSPTQLLDTLEIEYEEDDVEVEVEQLQGLANRLRPSLMFKILDTNEMVDFHADPVKWKKYLVGKCVQAKAELKLVQPELTAAAEQFDSWLNKTTPHLQLASWLQSTAFFEHLQFQGLRQWSRNGIYKQAWYRCNIVEIGTDDKATALFEDGIEFVLNKGDIRLKQKQKNVAETEKKKINPMPLPTLNVWQNDSKLFDLTEISVFAEKLNMAKDCVILLRKERISIQTFFRNYNSECWLKDLKLFDENNKRSARLQREVYKQVLEMTCQVIDAEKLRSLFEPDICTSTVNKAVIIQSLLEHVSQKLKVSTNLLDSAIRSVLTERTFGYYDIFELFKLGGQHIGTVKQFGSVENGKKRRKTSKDGYVQVQGKDESLVSSHCTLNAEVKEQKTRKIPKTIAIVKLKRAIEVEEEIIARASLTEKTVSRYARLLERAIEVGSERVNVELQGFQAIEQLIDNNETRSPNCAICLEDIRDPVCTECVHLFCEDCLQQHCMAMPLIRPGSQRHNSFPCPLCRRNLNIHDVIKIVKSKKPANNGESTDVAECIDSITQKIPRLCTNTSVQFDSTHQYDNSHRSNVEFKPQWFPAIESEEVESLIVRAMSCFPMGTGRSFPNHLNRLEAMDRRLLHFLAHMVGNIRFRPSDHSNHRSTKIMRLVRDIKEITAVKSNKIVLFSQFKSAIKHLNLILSMDGIGNRKIVKGDSKELLSRAVESFNFDPEVQVLLLHSSDTTAGLTLTRASYVFFLEPFLEKSAKDQAVNRAHRIGQDSQVHVRNYFVIGTVEERILAYMQWDHQACSGVESLEQLPNSANETARSQFLRFVAGLEN